MSKVKVVQKQGVINEEGKVIVPLKYDYVTVLQCGIYAAVVGDVELKEEESIRKKHYHYKRLSPVKDKSKVHLYSDKGEIIFTEPILEYIVTDDDLEKIVAVKVLDAWRLVEFDYENNILKSYYSIADEILDVCDGYIAVKRLNEGCTVYSLKNWERILDLREADKITIIKKSGFVVYEKKTGKAGFYNLSGGMILDYEWDWMECHLDHIQVKEYHSMLDVVKRRARYSYDGVELQMVVYKN